MKIKQLLLGTTNKGKVEYIQRLLKEEAIEILTLADMKMTVDEPEEIGKDPVEIATYKSTYYAAAYGIPTLSIDFGLYFDDIEENLQPGVCVKRVGGKEMEPTEMLSYYQNLVATHGGRLDAHWLRAFVITSGEDTEVFAGKDHTVFVEEVSKAPFRDDHPLASIQIEKDGRYRAEMFDEKIQYDFDDEIQSFLRNALELR